MEIEVRQINGWRNALEMARLTVNKGYNGKEPSEKWRREMIKLEHSPIREVRFLIKFKDIETWVAQHLARHDFGGESQSMDCAAVQYGATQRTDRTGVNRDTLSQSALTNHAMTCNAQDLINISRKRLCRLFPAKETREAWEQVKLEIAKIDPVVAEAMVPECIYRGGCHSSKSCGYYDKSQNVSKRSS